MTSGGSGFGVLAANHQSVSGKNADSSPVDRFHCHSPLAIPRHKGKMNAADGREVAALEVQEAIAGYEDCRKPADLPTEFKKSIDPHLKVASSSVDDRDRAMEIRPGVEETRCCRER